MIIIYLHMCEECFPLKLLMHLAHHSAQQEESVQSQITGSHQNTWRQDFVLFQVVAVSVSLCSDQAENSENLLIH